MDNNINNAQKAEIIAHALPHIQKYRKKTVVVKYGGNAMINDELKEAVMRDLVLLTTVGIKVVLVHGGGPAINKTLEKMHIESKFENGLRVTDKDTVDVVQMVLAGKVKCKALDDSHGFVGEIQEVNTEVIEEVLNHNFIPVISTIGYDEKGNCYNINADTAAAAVAGALKAEALVSMTDIVGLLRDKDDDSTLIHKVYISDTPALIAEGIISGGMIPKIDSMTQALREGVKKAFIIDGRVPHSILMELLTDEGMGTMFRSR